MDIFPAGPLEPSDRTMPVCYPDAGEAPRPQKFPAFSDFVKEVQSSWDCPASGPSVLIQAALLASLEGVEKLDLAGFPPVDSTIAALVKAQSTQTRDPACLNPQCRVTGTHLKRAYAVEVQATRLSKTVSVLMAYMDGVLRKALLLKPVATELHLRHTAADLRSPTASS
ncbi:UNVERIFIED_CONTAM: hypothetical protein FKN15_025228 [Acipenser sinensis]